MKKLKYCGSIALPFLSDFYFTIKKE